MKFTPKYFHALAFVLAGLTPCSSAARADTPLKHIRTPNEFLDRSLRLELPELENVRKAIAGKNQDLAWRELLSHLRTRKAPIDPQVSHWRAIKEREFIDQWAKHAFDYFPKHYVRDGRINWRNNNKPPKSEYESFEIRNRLMDLAGWTAAALASDRADLRKAVVETFLDWYRDCPPPELPVKSWWDGDKTGFAWQEIEVAFRGRMLVSILLSSLDWKEATPEFQRALLISIHQSMDFLTSQYDRFGLAARNHQNIHGYAILAAGALLPELKSADVWQKLGRRILSEHRGADFDPDGVQVEHSPHYHAKVFSLYLDAYDLLRQNGDPEARWIEKHLQKSANFLLYSAGPDGRIAPINDGWHTSTEALRRRAAKALDRPDLLAVEGETPPEKMPPLSRAFEKAGVAYLRSSWKKDAVYVVLDATHKNSGHWHAGKPHLVIHAGDQALACNPQLANYDDPTFHQYFKSADAHNTVLVDGEGDGLVKGPWNYTHVSNPKLTWFRSGKSADIVRATTDGFARLKSPVSFERTVVFVKPGLVFVHDVLKSDGNHRYDWLLHSLPHKPAIDSTAKSYQTRLGGPFELHCQPLGNTKDAVNGPVLKEGKHHDRVYPAQKGFWFPLQYGDTPAPVVAAPYGVWTRTADSGVSFDFLLQVLGKGESPVDVQNVAITAKEGTPYRLKYRGEEVLVVFDDRASRDGAPVEAAGWKMSSRVGVKVGSEEISDAK